MLVNLLQSTLKYLGTKSSLISVERLGEVNMLAAIKLKRARSRHPSEITNDITKFKVKDLILLKDLKKQNMRCKIYAKFGKFVKL